MTKKGRRIVILAAVILLMAGFFYWQNNDLGVTEYRYESAKLPAGFDGFTVVQVSDLHNKEFGKDQSRLLPMIEAADPDLIIITGDLVDSRRRGSDAALAFARGAVGIAPTCYSPGNHEGRIENIETLYADLEAAGVTLLLDRAVPLTHNGDTVTFAGATEAAVLSDNGFHALRGLCEEEFTLLLAHHPELYETYQKEGFDLVFSGHAHGGQIRIPGLGGMFSPGQGFFGGYTDGIHSFGETTLVISRGLGNSLFPFRIFNRPELVKVVLHTADKP